MENLKGYIAHIIYRSSENGFTVLRAVVDGKQINCVGYLPVVSEGESFQAGGKYVMHSIYGRQFQIETYEGREPEDVTAIERYLGSGTIKGVGQKLAEKIVHEFGEDTFEVIEKDPGRLVKIPGISSRLAFEISTQVSEKRVMRTAMIFLQQYGISAALSRKIFDAYGNRVQQVIRENPYQLAEDISGVGFRTADEIARKIGVKVDSDFRIRCGITYVMQQSVKEGHTYLPLEELAARAQKLLETPLTDLEDHLAWLQMDQKIVVSRGEDEDRVYLSGYYQKEIQVARMLFDLNFRDSIDEEEVLRKIRGIEELTQTQLDEKQRQGVMEAVRCGLTVITGGPGTGKTTTIRTLIAYFAQEELDIALAAPTGRAAKRMAEATGCEARTIHRLLEVSGGNGSKAMFTRNRQNPLEEKVIIIDEMSMVDINLMNSLLLAIPAGTRLIMVGDVNQLPSVGPGCVLRDIIEGGICTVVRLTTIFRQASESDIVVNAHKINRGEHMALTNRSRDFFFIRKNDAEDIIKEIILLVSKKLPAYVNAPQNEIQVLTPMRKGLLGVENLNEVMQEKLNPKDYRKQEHARGDTLFREGDRVMQIRNDYQAVWEVHGRNGAVIDHGTGVFNGDMGVIHKISESQGNLIVEFDENRFLSYDFDKLEDLELAYAVTVHKSQGSEYPAVVIPLFSGPPILMNRNLLYTAVTRAKNCVVLIGDEREFYRMIDNTSERKRYSTLGLRIQEMIS